MAENGQRSNDSRPQPKQKPGPGKWNRADVQSLLELQNIKFLIGAVVVVLMILLVVSGLNRRIYRSYKVVKASSQEDTISTKYVEIGERTLRYSLDGASLLDKNQETLWSDAYEMQNPIADICKETAVIADRGGTTAVVYNRTGRIGRITTGYSIVKVKVAKQGVVAAILDGGEDTWVNFYTVDGNLIAENQTRIDEPGYPMDLAVSQDGLVIMVAFQLVEGSHTASYVAFYNFASPGQSQIDNIVSGYTYEGVVIPQVQRLSNNRFVAFRDDGFVLYEGKQIPRESMVVEVEEEIISTFYDENHIGLVFKEKEEEDKMYRLEVYGSEGNKRFARSFSIPYTNIKLSDGYIIMYNSTQACIMNEKGYEKYNGTIDEGTIKDLFKIGENKYMLVLDTGVRVIKLS